MESRFLKVNGMKTDEFNLNENYTSQNWESLSRSERTKRAVVGSCQMTKNVVTIPVTTGIGKTLDQQVTLSLEDPSQRKPLLDNIQVFEANGEEIKDGSWKGQNIIEYSGNKMRLDKSGKASKINNSPINRASERNQNISLTFDEMSFDPLGVSYTGSLGISPPHAVSFLEDNYGYLAQLLAGHELLHLVGARHDNLLGCNTNEIMSERVTSPTPSEPKNYWTCVNDAENRASLGEGEGCLACIE
ncbi:hypothetical protein ACJMK2_033261 [Sinanodonta woodiana]|uniref:Uncharacterized protein n=1 Tax=Sinanodonta woodiana TaxID=1069815 RepID=A0ABD3X837_SINWO